MREHVAFVGTHHEFRVFVQSAGLTCYNRLEGRASSKYKDYVHVGDGRDASAFNRFLMSHFSGAVWVMLQADVDPDFRDQLTTRIQPWKFAA